MGEAALLRFYVLHCIGLPFIIMIFMAVHFLGKKGWWCLNASIDMVHLKKL